MAKEFLTLKRFMLRSEVIKLYRNYLKVGRLIDRENGEHGVKMRAEWNDWVKVEFRLRSKETSEEHIAQLISHGKRQLQELERSIRIAQN